MKIVEEEEGGYLIEIQEVEKALISFNPQNKVLRVFNQNSLGQFLLEHEDQLRRMLHNKKAESFYVGFSLAFSLIPDKDVGAFNNRDNLIVTDNGEIFVVGAGEGRRLTEVYTDGSYNDKNQRGGFCLLIKDLEGGYREMGFESASKSSALIELEAVLKALELVAGDLRIVTDSQYVRKGITEWILHWLENDWTTVNGSKARNIEVWKKLHELTKGRRIEWAWVKAHSNHFENDYCDYKSKEISGV
ncbi:MAG: hypothetical protein AVO33_02230 [delta proteobacterium ML8_F1]|nr:MAG: hypothetical protein AVO33_02230 [delta proteobacterium ML8_F1]